MIKFVTYGKDKQTAHKGGAFLGWLVLRSGTWEARPNGWSPQTFETLNKAKRYFWAYANKL